jgi:hypothetical protein
MSRHHTGAKSSTQWTKSLNATANASILSAALVRGVTRKRLLLRTAFVLLMIIEILKHIVTELEHYCEQVRRRRGASRVRRGCKKIVKVVTFGCLGR